MRLIALYMVKSSQHVEKFNVMVSKLTAHCWFSECSLDWLILVWDCGFCPLSFRMESLLGNSKLFQCKHGM